MIIDTSKWFHLTSQHKMAERCLSSYIIKEISNTNSDYCEKSGVRRRRFARLLRVYFLYKIACTLRVSYILIFIFLEKELVNKRLQN
jgi:hypothetical protein